MNVSIAHLIEFYNARIECRLESIANSEIEYARLKKIYEAKFLPKLFGWKYENSCNGSRGCFGSWDFSWDKDAIKTTKAILLKLKYHMKCGDVVAPLNQIHADAFYSYCDKNNIPY